LKRTCWPGGTQIREKEKLKIVVKDEESEMYETGAFLQEKELLVGKPEKKRGNTGTAIK